MNFYTLTINDKDYKLCLTTRSMCELEKKLGFNPIMLLSRTNENNLPTIQEMVLVLFFSLQKYQHSIKYDDVYDIFDDYIADGHSPIEFVGDIVEIYKVSGLLKVEDDEDEDEKNA